MRNAIAAIVILLASGLGGAFGEDPPRSDAPKDQKAEAKVASTTADAEEELKLPPGWKKTKRGKHTLYCKTEAPMGTRLKSTTCYDRDNMRNYILALQENKSDVDRIRSTCSNLCTCGDPSAC